MTELKVSGVRQLGALLKVSKTVAAELAKQSWFPAKAQDGSWATSEVMKAYEAFKDRRDGKLGAAPAPNVPPAAPPRPAGSVPIVPGATDDELRETLRTSSNPEELANAQVQRVARALANVQVLEVKHVIAFKTALEELRRSTSGYLEIAKEKGSLISRDVAKTVIGQLARRAILLLERHEVELAARVEAWFGDEKFRSLTSEERTREVRTWAQEKTYELRAIESAEVEALVAAEVKEQAKK